MKGKILQKLFEEVRKHKEIDLVSLLTKNKNDLISFSGEFDSYCIGFVDIVGSTKVAAHLTKEQACRFYAAFLNAMAIVVKEFDAKIVKNTGDSLMFYFPRANSDSKFVNSLECGLEMIRLRKLLNKIMKEENLPSVQYRVSLDYGTVMIAKQVNSQENDLFGPSVNMCSKINHMAEPNSLVVGGDLFEIVKSYGEFHFREINGYAVGVGVDYPIYSVIPDEGDLTLY